MKQVSERSIGQLISAGTLALGLCVGFALGSLYHPQQSVEAQAYIPVTPVIKEISPGFATGTLGANLIMAHEIATDSLVINGYDLLKMDKYIIDYLATRPLAERADLQNLINASHADTIYRLPKPVTPVVVPEKKP